ncbi:MAG: hypothetical protein BRD40_00010, partial [Bacteroidetes bacterium QS_1_65_9]
MTYRVRLSTAGVPGINDPDQLLVLKREDAGDAWTPLDTERDGDVLVSDTLSSFSQFTIGGDESVNPLPVELTTFTATAEGDGRATLTWTTAAETSNDGFHVERSTDGGATFEKIGFREGAGTTTEAQRYRFTDTRVPYDAEQVAYRLRQTDRNGEATYSDPVTVERGGPEAFALRGVFPN